MNAFERARRWLQDFIAWVDEEMDKAFYGDAWTKSQEGGKMEADQQGGQDHVGIRATGTQEH